MLVSAAYRMTRPPRVVGGLAMLYGYFKSMVQGNHRYGDPEFRRFLRRYQWACLLRGKTSATARLNDRQRRFWDPSPSPGCNMSGESLKT
jgi:poly-beta-1,6-N-acetyl-D-glucosamine synthase